jgi:hypothetical protein
LFSLLSMLPSAAALLCSSISILNSAPLFHSSLHSLLHPLLHPSLRSLHRCSFHSSLLAATRIPSSHLLLPPTDIACLASLPSLRSLRSSLLPLSPPPSFIARLTLRHAPHIT